MSDLRGDVSGLYGRDCVEEKVGSGKGRETAAPTVYISPAPHSLRSMFFLLLARNANAGVGGNPCRSRYYIYDAYVYSFSHDDVDDVTLPPPCNQPDPSPGICCHRGLCSLDPRP